MPIVLILLWVFGTRGVDKSSENMIYETESAYNYIQVLEIDDYRYLRLNEGQGFHSVYSENELFYGGPGHKYWWRLFLTQPRTALIRFKIWRLLAWQQVPLPVKRRLFLGNDIQMDGFEIDPKIVEVGRDYFGMTEPNLNVIVEDGRWGLEYSENVYDVISVDAYRPPYIPWHMTTVEFFEIVYNHLSDQGVMVINIGRSPLDRTLVNDLATTIRQSFPTVFVMDVPNSFNTILFATRQTGSWDNLWENYAQLSSSDSTNPLLLEAMATALMSMQPEPEMTRVYTDDKTPIEWVTNKIVLDYILGGDIGDLQ